MNANSVASVVSLALLLVGCTADKVAESTEATPAPSKEAEFWTWFAERQDEIPDQTSAPTSPVMQELGSRLMKYREGVVWEMSVGTNPRELYISAEGIRERFDDVRKLVAAAPPLPGWKIIPFRQRKPGNNTMSYGGVSIKFDRDKYTAREAGGRLHLDLYLADPQYGSDNAVGAAFLSLDSIVGEVIATTKLGEIKWRPLREAPKGAKVLAELWKEPLIKAEIDAGRTF